MYDMPFIPPTAKEQEESKRLKNLAQIIYDMEERVLELSTRLDYLDAQAHNIQLQLDHGDEYGDAYDIPDGRIPH